jgi:hypothetical protein
MIATALFMMIPPPPPPFGPLRGNIDCLLEKGADRYSAVIEIDQSAASGQVILRGLGLAPDAGISTVELNSGAITGRTGKGEPGFQLTPASPGKWGKWWRYAAGRTSGVCYGNLYGEETSKAVLTTVASIEVN